MRVLFDRDDLDILEEIELLERENAGSAALPIVPSSSHAEGIIELAASVEFRIAEALSLLLNSTSRDEHLERLRALQRLKHDVSAIKQGLRLNAGRVLLEIMKEIFACGGDKRRRLELIRDFREVYTGKPRIVRRQLRFYQLLEVPEDSSQLSFDDNVANASKLGKKNPAYLILDAWIKGVRTLQVIVSNYVTPKVAYELLSAGEILDVEVEIGIELPVYYNRKFIRIVWTPLGINAPSAFLRFLKSNAVQTIFKDSEQVDAYHQGLIIDLLSAFDRLLRTQVEIEYNVRFSALDSGSYLRFLGESEPNEVNLSEFIFSAVASVAEREAGDKLIPEIILLRYLTPLSLSQNISPETACRFGSLAADIKGLMQLLNTASGISRLTLHTSNLHSWEVPDILYQSKGRIDAVEIFNLRDFILAGEGVIKYGDGRINQFRKAINERNISKIKTMISEDILEVTELEIIGREEIIAALQKVRKNIGKLLDRYAAVHIEPSIGSGSAGRGKVFYGMGLVVKQSLERKAALVLEHAGPTEHLALPLGCQVYKRVEYLIGGGGLQGLFSRFASWRKRRTRWVRQMVNEIAGTNLDSNIYTLSGRFGEEIISTKTRRCGYCWEYLNTDMKNLLKIFIGFIPAFLTFYYTADWAVLKYGGGLIWLGITGGRNIFQSVLSAGGFAGRLNFSWSSLVDKKRIAESLMYTGLSVPLLEYLVRLLFLQELLGVNAAAAPLIVYAVMSGVNGLYIAGHNYLRGFSRAAIIGNLFRSVLALPVSLLLSTLVQGGLELAAVAGVANIVSQWSAVISKTASDIVACIIEGVADRAAFITLRQREIKELEIKFLHLCEKFELLVPNKPLNVIFADIEGMVSVCREKESRALEELVLLFLDILYFWNSKPRARASIRILLRSLSREERMLFREAVNILLRDDIVKQSLTASGVAADIAGIYEYYFALQEKFVREFILALHLE